MHNEYTDGTGWFRYKIIGDIENINILNNEGAHIPAKIWEEHVSTGKQRVHAGYRVVLSFQEKKYESSIKASTNKAIKDLAEKAETDGYKIMIWGAEDGFSQTGLSSESGYGYFEFPDGTKTGSVRAIAGKISLEDFIALQEKKAAEAAAAEKARKEVDTHVRNELRHLAEYLANPTLRCSGNFGGAGVILTEKAPEKIDSGAYSSKRFVVTKYSKELSWFFIKLRDIFYSENLLNYSSKIEFFGRLANAAIRHLEKNKNSSAHDLCASVLQEGFLIYEEMRNGCFFSLNFTFDNSIFDDYLDEEFHHTKDAREFFKNLGIEIFSET